MGVTALPTLRVVTSLLVVDDLSVEVTRTRVRRVNLRVHPPEGSVRVSAPYHTSDREIAAFVASRRAWIEHHRDRLRREAPVEVSDGTMIRLWGQQCRVEVVEAGTRGRVVALEPGRIVIRVPPGSSEPIRRRLLDGWLRRQATAEVGALVTRWSPFIGVRVTGWTIRRMTTRWGSATPDRGRITLNLDLVAESPEYLQYVVVHEMVHLVEPGHGRGFQRLMDRHLPGWKGYRRTLNRGLAGLDAPD
jgi:hypothetical protein